MSGLKSVGAALVALIAFTAAAADLVGRAEIVDGDTIRVAGESVRIEGIDAPESAQECWKADGTSYHCGASATSFLATLIRGAEVACDVSGTDRYGRALGYCSANGIDLNAEMVRSGWALAFRRYSDRYIAEETEAQVSGAGLWQGTFVDPWDWRSGAVTQAMTDQRSCVIKGNISRSGELIYHLPFQQHYNRTKITPQKGERWFCTEDEALEAGWRRTLR